MRAALLTLIRAISLLCRDAISPSRRVTARHGASRRVTARHGAAGASRCATWYMVRAGQRAVHVASLIEAFMGHLIRAISL